MIGPKLLTPEFGFEEGCVVEIVSVHRGISKFVEYFHSDAIRQDTYFGKDYSYRWGNNDWTIRPLTGPMAIWNFAPDWADVYRKNSNGIHQFSSIATVPDLERYSWIARPWWAKK